MQFATLIALFKMSDDYLVVHTLRFAIKTLAELMAPFSCHDRFLEVYTAEERKMKTVKSQVQMTLQMGIKFYKVATNTLY